MLIIIKAPSRQARAYSYDRGNQTLAQLLEEHDIRASKAFSRGRTVHLVTVLDASFSERLIELI